MKIECPACATTGSLDESKLPAEGRAIVCPSCRHRFMVRPERSAVDIIQRRETMVCPKCQTEQPVAESCTACGIVFQRFVRARVHQQEKERLEFVKLRSETRSVNGWYRDLFDRRLTALLVRSLSLLLLLGLFVTCSAKKVKRNQLMADAMMKSANEKPTRSPQQNDAAFVQRFAAVDTAITENADRCFVMCYNYSNMWYQQGNRDHYLSETMQQEVESIVSERNNVRTLFGQLPTPSEKYWPCYVSMKKLHNTYEDIYAVTADYNTHYANFSERLTAINSEYLKQKGEVNACKQSFN